MPRPARDLSEVEIVKNQIIDEASQIIAEYGYDFFSMRKLAARLGIAAKTIYNYFSNKDELYFMVLTRGFEDLYTETTEAMDQAVDVKEKTRALCRAYLRFGLENPHYYDLMFNLNVPKYMDYLDTPLEEIARQENETAMRLTTLAEANLRDLAAANGCIEPDAARAHLFHIWSVLHGMVSLTNSRVTYEVITVDSQVIERTLEIALERYLNPAPN